MRQRVGRGLVAGDDEDDHHGDELVVAEAVAAVGSLYEGGEEVLARTGAPIGGELDDEVGRSAERPVRLGHRLGSGAGLVHGDERLGDPDRGRGVLVPDAEHVEDHLGGQHLGHVGEQVDLGTTGHGVELALDRRRHRGAQPLSAPPREDRAHEAPQPGVHVAVRRQHHAAHHRGREAVVVRTGCRRARGAHAPRRVAPHDGGGEVVAGHVPEVERRSVHRRPLPQLGVERTWVGGGADDDRFEVGVELVAAVGPERHQCRFEGPPWRARASAYFSSAAARRRGRCAVGNRPSVPL